MCTLTSVSVAVLDVTEDLLILSRAASGVGESTTGGCNECVWLGLSDRGELSLGMGEVEGVGLGEGRGERVPISMASSSAHARPQLRR